MTKILPPTVLTILTPVWWILNITKISAKVLAKTENVLIRVCLWMSMNMVKLKMLILLCVTVKISIGTVKIVMFVGG